MNPATATSPAVFLSYASQDADTVRLLCDALRAAGVEVWFDQNELVGGDAWDAKIRKQIKECALFVPIISANTNARAEGYFRLEWKLAVDRSHLMADDAPFLFPVVLDDVSDASARVPDRFRDVQWSRLGGKDTPESIARRLASLLHGTPADASPPAQRPSPRARPPAERGWLAKWWWLVFPVSGMATMLVHELRRPRQTETTAAAPAAAAPVANSELQRAQAILDASDAIPSDVALAEELCRGVLAQRVGDPAATVLMARVQTYWILRGFDRSEQRFAQAKQFCERALALRADDPEAMAAMGTYLVTRGIDHARAAKLFRAAIAARPQETRFYRMLDNVLATDPAVPEEEVLASAKRTADRFPTDALAQYEAARHFRDAARLEETDHYLDLAIKYGPVTNALIAKARLSLTVRGDTAAMKSLLDQLPERYRETDRAVFSRFVYALASGDYDLGLAALRASPEPWMSDFEYTGPKALLEGELLLLQGKPELARLRFETAQTEYTQHAAVTNVGFRSMWLEAWLLARLGRIEEARTRNAVIFPEYQRPFQIYLGQGWWFNPIALNLMLGERAKALDLMREAVDFQEGRRILRVALTVDPRMRAYRADPQIRALLEAPSANGSAKIALSNREWPKNPELKRAIALIDGLEAIRDDFVLAEEIAKRELDQRPADPEAVTVMARVQSQYLLRSFDRRDSRAALAGQYAERAVQLSPDDPEALFALSNYLGARGIEPARAEAAINRACALDPGQPRYWRLAALNVTDRAAGITVSEANVRRFPADALTRYDLSIRYRNAGRLDEFERELDTAIALAPIANAILWKSRAMLGLHRDLPGMKTWLDKVPARVTSQERTVYSRFLYAALSGDYDYGTAALRAYPDTWFFDAAEYGGPTALLHATLLELQGKPALARLQYEAALVEVQRQKLAMPTDLWVRRAELWVLRGLGRLDEARAQLRDYTQVMPRPAAISPIGGWFFSATALSLLLDDRELALPLLTECAEGPSGRDAIKVHLGTDPRVKSFRDDPAVQALLHEPASKE